MSSERALLLTDCAGETGISENLGRAAFRSPSTGRTKGLGGEGGSVAAFLEKRVRLKGDPPALPEEAPTSPAFSSPGAPLAGEARNLLTRDSTCSYLPWVGSLKG